MTSVAGEILVRRVDVIEGVPFRVKLLEIRAVPLRKDGVAEIAVVRSDGLFAVSGFVIAIMATKTPGPFLVTDVVWIRAPIRLHLREEVRFENCMRGGNHLVDL